MKLQEDEIHHMDCLVGLKLLPENFANLVIADPPFNIAFHEKSRENLYNRKKNRVLEGYIEAPRDYLQFSKEWIGECARILKSDGLMYIVSGFNHLDAIYAGVKEAGLHIQNQLIWQYQFPPNRKKGFNTSHYNILFISKHPKKYPFDPYKRFAFNEITKEGKKAHYLDRSSVWKISRENWAGYKTTRTRLPKELIVKMIQYGTYGKRQQLVDPFSGSGIVSLVGREMGHQCCAFEISKCHWSFSTYRLNTGKYKVSVREYNSYLKSKNKS